MRIGVNVLYLIPGKVGGTETYARELIARLSRSCNLVVYCGRESTASFMGMSRVQVVTLPIYSRHRVLRLLAEQILLPYYLWRDRVDVIFSLGYSAPFIHSVPSVVTIHDLNWYYHPEDFGYTSRIIWQFMTKLSAKTADHVITDSDASAKSLREVLGLAKSKVTSILHGTPATLAVKLHHSDHPYLFTVLADYPHKNLATLLDAFAQLRLHFPKLELIVCGLGSQPSSGNGVTYLGYVTREELASLYKGAAVFVFPSAYEGFGYPPLEAMSYGVPVVSSNAFSLSEVVGEGGLLVDPYDVAGYVAAITAILTSKARRTSLIAAARKRASELKWEDTANSTLKVLQGVTTHE